MPNFHYNVHVISQTPGLDVTLWVGVTLGHKNDPAENFCPDESDLGRAAIARARELCPALKDCTCDEWNGGDRVLTPEEKFLGADYKEKMAKLKVAIKPFLAALDELNMQLCVDHRNEYFLTAIPQFDESGDLPKDVDSHLLLDATYALADDQHLVAVID